MRPHVRCAMMGLTMRFQKAYVRFIILVVCTPLAFIPVSLVQALYLALGVVFAYLLTPRFFRKIAPTKLMAGLIAVPFFMFILQMTGFAIWLLNPNASITPLPGITSLLLLVPFLFWRPEHKERTTRWANREDLLSVALAVALVGLVCAQVLIRFPGLPQQSVIGLLDGNVDDGAHIALMNDRIELDRGFLKRSTYEQSSRVDTSFNSYPLGWHIANASVYKAFFGSAFSEKSVLYFYAITKVVWFFWVAALFFRFAYSLYSRAHKNGSKSFVLLSSLLFLFAIYLLIDHFRLGFYSFFPQLLSIMLLAYSLLAFDKTKNSKGLVAMSIPIIVFSVSGGLVWTLLLPVMVLAGTIPLFVRLRNLTGPLYRKLLKEALAFLPLFLIASLAVLSQAKLLWAARFDSTGSIIDSLNTFGNIVVYGWTFITVVVVGFIAYLFLESRTSKHPMQSPLLLTALLTFFTATIYLIQMFSVEKTSYYFYKTFDSLLFLIVPMAVCGIVLCVEAIATNDKVRRFATQTTALFLVLMYAGFPAGNTPTVSYVSGKLGLDSKTASLVFDRMTTAKQNEGFTFVYLQDKPFETDIANVLLKSGPRFSSCYRNIRPSFTDGTSLNDIVKITQRVCSDTPISIYAGDGASYNELSSSVSAHNAGNHIRIYQISR